MVDNIEEAEDWLERLEYDDWIGIDDFESVSTTKKALDSVFESFNRPPATPRQAEAIFNAGTTSRLNFPKFGISRLQYVNQGRVVTRYNIPGRRGLFNFQSALKHYQGLQ